MTIKKSTKKMTKSKESFEKKVNRPFETISQKIDNLSDMTKDFPAYSTVEMGERKLSKTEKDILRYTFRPLRHLTFASNDYNMMDYIMFITPSKEGYNISQFKFTHNESTDDGLYPITMINNVDVNNLNDAIKLIETIFNEKTDISCDRLEGEKDVDEWYRSKDEIVIGVLLTRFKNSNNWIQLFIEGSELEIALHNNFDVCIDHILMYYGC